MNKLINLGKSFYGFIIYIAIAYIFSFIIKNINISNNTLYVTLLILSEITTLALLLFVFRKKIKKDFKDFDKNYKKYLALGFKIWLIGLIVMIISNSIIHYLITNSIPYNQELNIIAIKKLPLYSVISAVMVGPLIEEITFRLSFKENLTNKKLYYILSVVLFAGIHTINGITSPLELLYFIPYGSLALAFSYILDKTDNVFTTTVIHSLHNALSIILISFL